MLSDTILQGLSQSRKCNQAFPVDYLLMFQNFTIVSECITNHCAVFGCVASRIIVSPIYTSLIYNTAQPYVCESSLMTDIRSKMLQ